MTAHDAIARAREEFLALVEGVRPELHRYCARLTGSVIDGEDVVQDALAKAFYALGLAAEVPPLRPWLFRIAHNAALDFLRSHDHKLTERRAELADVASADEREPDPFATRIALAHFLALPVVQRSAVILKDVLGQSLEEAALTMDTTVLAVKAALVRGRAGLREAADADADAGARGPAPAPAVERAALDRYASAFNARDWDRVRAMIGDDCRLDLVSRSQRRGKAVGAYFSRYERENVELRVATIEGDLGLAAFTRGATAPSYFILLAFDDGGRVTAIRDFRYIPYITHDATIDLDLAEK